MAAPAWDLLAAFASRYTEYVALGVFGLYLYTLGGNWTRRALTLPLLALLLFACLRTLLADQVGMQYYHDIKATWRACYLKTEDIRECDRQSKLWVYPFPERTNLKQKLDYLKQARENLYSDLPGPVR